MFKIQIPRNMVRALVRFSAVKDVRYYLNGVHVAVHANVAHIVATDGHTLAFGRIAPHANDRAHVLQGHGSAIIPADVLRKVKAHRHDYFPLELTVDGNTFTLADGDATHGGKVIDGKFPDYQRVIPALTVSGAPAQFNPEYLARCFDAVRDLRGKHAPFPGIAYNGTGPALVELDADVFAVIMPMRQDPADVAPAWAREDGDAFGRELDVDVAQAAACAQYDRLAIEACDVPDFEAPYGERVARLEALGLTTSDAQAAVAAEDDGRLKLAA